MLSGKRPPYSAQDALILAKELGVRESDLAERIYTSRLLGGDPSLVLSGGGNTSVKGERLDLFGRLTPCLWVKGSGSNLKDVGARDFPALRLEGLLSLRGLAELSDEEMINQLRLHLFDSTSPNPSVEALLHAFIPLKFVDHSHADAVVALTNQERRDVLREALGEVEVLPYIMPGFPLAKAVADAFDRNPQMRVLVLEKHGLFTFGDTAKESYERHLEVVSRCEAFLANASGPVGRPNAPPPVRELAPRLRGAFHAHVPAMRMVMEHRFGDAVMRELSACDPALWEQTGPLTPDHVIRTKPWPLWLGDDVSDQAITAAVDRFVERYRDYFLQGVSRSPGKSALDPAPRVVLSKNHGILAWGKTRADAIAAADIAEHTVLTKAASARVGRYEGLPDEALFDMEYWSLEQAKLGKMSPRTLEGRVAVVTGGAGAIGRAIAEMLCENGSAVALFDRNEEALRDAVEELRRRFGQHAALGCVADLSQTDQVNGAFDETLATCGGLDIVIANAGIARVKPIEESSAELARTVMDVNYLGVLNVVREAIPVLRRQGMGGDIVINSSKNVFAPGKDFGSYSASKAAAHQLGKVAAIELAPLGVRVNMINADAVFAHGDTPSGLWQEVGPDRARSRGLTMDGLATFYQERNLLRTPVTARDVANAVRFFVTRQTPTTGATLPVDGGIPDAFPR